MPRIISIARSNPTRSSVVRCSVTSGGTSEAAVSVAIWRYLPSRFLCVARDRRGFAGPGGRDLRRCPVRSEPTTKRVTLDQEDGRVGLEEAAPVAPARGVAVAHVRRADA